MKKSSPKGSSGANGLTDGPAPSPFPEEWESQVKPKRVSSRLSPREALDLEARIKAFVAKVPAILDHLKSRQAAAQAEANYFRDRARDLATVQCALRRKACKLSAKSEESLAHLTHSCQDVMRYTVQEDGD